MTGSFWHAWVIFWYDHGGPDEKWTLKMRVCRCRDEFGKALEHIDRLLKEGKISDVVCFLPTDHYHPSIYEVD